MSADPPATPDQAASAKEPDWARSLHEALAHLEREGADPAVYLLRHGSMRVGAYAPQGVDDQTPHSQDELYIVVRGEARFRKEETVREVRAGDVMFVEAGAPHRFEAMSRGFLTWVVFWGPPGGEDPRRKGDATPSHGNPQRP
jgi:mannose-6-phosphate isomerase-like protein (cupin superfamily)